MTAEAERIPTLPTPEQLPEGAVTGEELRHFVLQELTASCEGARLDPAVRERLMTHVERWLTISPGVPVLELGYNQDTKAAYFESGGVALTPLYGTRSPSDGCGELRIDIAKEDYDGSTDRFSLHRYVDVLAVRFIEPDAPPHWVVGEQGVGEWMGKFGKLISEDSEDSEDIYAQVLLAECVRRTTFPLECLGLSDDERVRAANMFLMHIVDTSTPKRQQEAYKALCYLLGISADTEQTVLREVIEDQWVDMLPVAPGQSDSGVAALTLGLLPYYELPPAFRPGRDQFVPNDVRHASYMADLYDRRAAKEAARGHDATPEPTLSVVHAGEQPDPRPLAILTDESPDKDTVVADIMYLRQLQAAGIPIMAIHERSDVSMRRAARHICDRAMMTNDPALRLKAFAALEHLCDLNSELQREGFYRLLIERFALTVPFDSNAALHRHVGVAEAIGRLMPNPPVLPNISPLTGTARTAAVMGHMYRRRAFQLLKRHLRRYTPLEVDQEDVG